MAKTSIIVPGTMATALSYQNALNAQVFLWPNAAQLLLDGFFPLALDTNGIDPAPRVGKSMAAAGVLATFYDALRERLSSALPADWTKLLFAYDWRKSPLATGAALASEIAQRATPTDPVYLTCHSQGGLLARVAWALLKAQGKENLIAKIVTLGTPHYGCYSIADAYGLRDNLTNDIARIGIFAIPTLTFPVRNPNQLGTLKGEILPTINTWPSMYALMPRVGSQSVQPDPLAQDWYVIAQQPQDIGISAAWLTWGLNDWNNYFLAAGNTPGPTVMKCVAGEGTRTIQSIADKTKLAETDGFNYSTDGDGVVSVWSALAGSTNREVVKCEHQLLPRDGTVLEKIVDWLQETVAPTPIPEKDLIDAAAQTVGTPSYAPDVSAFTTPPKSILPGSGACVVGGCKC